MVLTTVELLTLPADVARQAETDVTGALKTDEETPQDEAGATPGPHLRSFVASPAISTYSAKSTSASAGLSDPQVTNLARTDMGAIADNVRGARSAFASVHELMEEVDRLSSAVQITDSLFSSGSPFAVVINPGQAQQTHLTDKWITITGDFEKALRASLVVAPRAILLMKTVDDLLGSAPGKSTGYLKERLRQFMEQLRVEEARALQMKNDFQNIVDRIRIFWAEVNMALEKPKLAELRNEVVRRLQAQIQQLTVSLNALQQRMAGLTSALLRETVPSGQGAAILFFQLCPSAFMLWMENVYGNSSVGQLLSNVAAEMHRTDQQIVSIKREIEQARQHPVVRMFDTQFHIDDAACKLDTVVNVWQTMNLDMHALSGDLDMNTGPDMIVTNLTLSRLKVTKELYAMLTWVLE